MVLALLLPAAVAATSAPSALPSVSPTLPPAVVPPAVTSLWLVIWASTLGAVTLGFIGFAVMQSLRRTTAQPVTDRDLEIARISYGFWLIIGGLLLTLAVVIVTMARLTDTAQIIAIITAVTGVVGTLTAAFFGIQAAGAGRSQALSALSDQMKGQAGTGTDLTMTPAVGPHAGNTRVTIKGNDLTKATDVNFGAKPGSNFEVGNDGLIHVTSPAVDLDTNATTQQGKSDVQVAIVFPPGTPNQTVGTFYYYTVKADPNYVNIYGTGLTGASNVKFGNNPAIPVASANDAHVQVASPLVKAQNIWNQEVEVAVQFASDSADKFFVIGKFAIPEPSDKDLGS